MCTIDHLSYGECLQLSNSNNWRIRLTIVLISTECDLPLSMYLTEKTCCHFWRLIGVLGTIFLINHIAGFQYNNWWRYNFCAVNKVLDIAWVLCCQTFLSHNHCPVFRKWIFHPLNPLLMKTWKMMKWMKETLFIQLGITKSNNLFILFFTVELYSKNYFLLNVSYCSLSNAMTFRLLLMKVFKTLYKLNQCMSGKILIV
jgi:hypothetical protein